MGMKGTAGSGLSHPMPLFSLTHANADAIKRGLWECLVCDASRDVAGTLLNSGFGAR